VHLEQLGFERVGLVGRARGRQLEVTVRAVCVAASRSTTPRASIVGVHLPHWPTTTLIVAR
jgi:hypothetical protein